MSVVTTDWREWKDGYFTPRGEKPPKNAAEFFLHARDWPPGPSDIGQALWIGADVIIRSDYVPEGLGGER